MAFRLIDQANGISDPRRRALVSIYARSTPMLGALPIVTDPMGIYKFERESVLGNAGFRALNAGFAESTGTTETVVELTYELGGDLDIDRVFLRGDNGEKRAMQEAMKITRIAQTFDFHLIKGDHVADNNSFHGLQARAGTTGVNVIDANGALSLSTHLDRALEDTANPTHLLMSKAMRRRLTAASRNSSVGGEITRGVDEFGRQISFYAGLPILIADPVGHGQIPLAFNETNTGGGAASTSIYVLSLTENGGVFGLQTAPPDIRDLGELDAKPSERTRIDWSCGLVVSRPDAFTRIRRIADLAVTA